MSRPTIRDVAERAGVSIATVSYVLNGTGKVSATTADRVRACVEELGYRANSVAVAHRTGRSRTIGLAIADLTNPFFPEFARGVHRAAAENGFSVFLLDAQGCDEHELEGLEMLSDRVPEGLIWVPVGRDVLSSRPAPLPFPVVTFDCELPDFDSVNADVRRGGQLQAEVIASQGHRRLGLITGPEWSDTGRLRRAGLLDALPPDCELVWEFPLDYSTHIPVSVRREILRHHVDCVVTANDIQAIGLLQLYRDAGRRVPDDVSVIGFDDIDLAARISPGLTTVHLPVATLGRTAFDVLLDRIKNPDLPRQRRRLDVAMTMRGSTRSRVADTA
jgi:LacI family transcriptional regulator